VVQEGGKAVGPLKMKDLDIARNPNYSFASNRQILAQDNPTGPYTTSPSTTRSAITDSPSLERKARRNNGKPVLDIDSQEVEKDGEHVDKEQQQPVQKPKKTRVIWTKELHNKFKKAYNQLLSEGGNEENHCPTLHLNCF
jgi:hypothetical protein